MARDLPGHIRKAFRSVERFLPVVDLLVELVDARMPASSRITGFIDRMGKGTVVALGKADLADPEATRLWQAHIEKTENRPCVALDAREPIGVRGLNEVIRQAALAARPAGSTRQLRRIMIIGIPNVGKSTLINALAGRKAARAANLPGVTRSIQWIKLAGHLELLDLPGILDYALLHRGDLLRLINTMPGSDDDPQVSARLLCDLLRAAGQADAVPGLAEAAGSFEGFLEGYARRLNFVRRQAEPDLHRAAWDIVRRFQAGGFGRLTLEAPGTTLTIPGGEPLPEAPSGAC
jgi:ribosome biogenesis GTPase A